MACYHRAVEEFGSLLAHLRQAGGLSQNALARRAGINPGTVNRLESGQRAPSNRDLVMTLADALALAAADRDRLLAAAGHLPIVFDQQAVADPALRLAADILADETIPAAEREEFRTILRLVAKRWRPDPVEPDPEEQGEGEDFS